MKHFHAPLKVSWALRTMLTVLIDPWLWMLLSRWERDRVSAQERAGLRRKPEFLIHRQERRQTTGYRFSAGSLCRVSISVFFALIVSFSQWNSKHGHKLRKSIVEDAWRFKGRKAGTWKCEWAREHVVGLQGSAKSSLGGGEEWRVESRQHEVHAQFSPAVSSCPAIELGSESWIQAGMQFTK